MRELKPTPLTVPLSWIYGSAASLFHGAYDVGIRKPIDLGPPVISIGNLVVGGTGKTPVVLALAQTILDRDLKPAILTRGFRGTRTGLLQDSRWETGEPAGLEAGDEPLHLTRSLSSVTIGVGIHRAETGRRILEREHVDIFLLDDGFQHRRLVRQANLLLLDAGAPFGNHWLLPAGPLREPPSALKRADAVLLTGAEASETRLRRFDGPVWKTRPRLEHFETLSGEKRTPPSLPVMGVAGIARPERFWNFLREHGLELRTYTSHPDHHAYTKDDVLDLERNAGEQGCVLVTTAKDAVRLAPYATSSEWYVAILGIEIEGGWDAFLEHVLPGIFTQKERSGTVAAPESLEQKS